MTSDVNNKIKNIQKILHIESLSLYCYHPAIML